MSGVSSERPPIQKEKNSPLLAGDTASCRRSSPPPGGPQFPPTLVFPCCSDSRAVIYTWPPPHAMLQPSWGNVSLPDRRRGAFTRHPLPHHRAYGSLQRRSESFGKTQGTPQGVAEEMVEGRRASSFAGYEGGWLLRYHLQTAAKRGRVSIMHGLISAPTAFKAASIEAAGSGEKTTLFVAHLLRSLRDHRASTFSFTMLHKAGVIQR